MLRHYTLQFSDLCINIKMIDELLGYKGHSSPEPFPEMISGLLSKAVQYCNIEGEYVSYNNVEINFSKLFLKVNDTYFNTGKTILARLKKSEHVVFFKCTAGKGIEDWSKKLAEEGDLLSSYIISVIGSAVVEVAMDKIQNFLKDELEANNLKITNRYSPGYCGWKVTEQKKLFNMFPANFCHIVLTDSMMMDPVKSVSGIIGVGKEVKYNAYTCEVCNSQNCLYKNLKRLKNSSAISQQLRAVIPNDINM